MTILTGLEAPKEPKRDCRLECRNCPSDVRIIDMVCIQLTLAGLHAVRRANILIDAKITKALVGVGLGLVVSKKVPSNPGGVP